jgi:hypothetical protein
MAEDEAIADTIDARRRQQVADTVEAGRTGLSPGGSGPDGVPR